MSIPFTQFEFASQMELVSYARDAAIQHGYALAIKRSRKYPSGEWKSVDLQCDLGGSYDDRHQLTAETRRRNCGSRLHECPYEVTG